MTQFVTQISNPPIYSSLTKASGATYTNAAIQEATNSSGDQTGANWQKWFQEVTTQANQSQYYGNPSILLNSDFYWNQGITTPVTADGSQFSEKWFVTGSSVTTFSSGFTPYSNTDADNIGSIYYNAVQVSSFTGGKTDFYFYQVQSGAQFLRRYQNRQIIMSAKVTNNVQATLMAQFSLTFVYNGSPNSIIQSGVISIGNGVNELSGTLNTSPLQGLTITGTPYVIFKLAFFGFVSTANFSINYIKAEMANTPTILYVDHALERTRINNS